MTPEKVAQAMVAGLDKDQNSGEILVGWQSYLAVWCQRIFPQLLQKILVLTAPTF
jgi:3-oxoacyl-[acyl-carrier protein] reductase